MPHDVRKSLLDAVEACRAIQKFSTGLTLESYQASHLHRSAIERQFEILGEALNTVRREAPHFSNRIPEIHRIIGMRNHIIHGYANVNDAIVWDVVQSRIPHLIRVLERERKSS